MSGASLYLEGLESFIEMFEDGVESDHYDAESRARGIADFSVIPCGDGYLVHERCSGEKRILSNMQEIEVFASEIVQGLCLELELESLVDRFGPEEGGEYFELFSAAVENEMRDNAIRAWRYAESEAEEVV